MCVVPGTKIPPAWSFLEVAPLRQNWTTCGSWIWIKPRWAMTSKLLHDQWNYWIVTSILCNFWTKMLYSNWGRCHALLLNAECVLWAKARNSLSSSLVVRVVPIFHILSTICCHVAICNCFCYTCRLFVVKWYRRIYNKITLLKSNNWHEICNSFSRQTL